MTQVLKEHFPQCFDKNGDLMPHKLQEAILDLAQENNAQANTATQDLENEAAFSLSKESYSLNWLGKSYAKLLRHLPTHTLIAQDSAHNAQPQNANSKNVLIKGDNLEVLKHLKNAYYRKVKMIYIDPPYNTGNGDFIYNDERSFTPQSLAQMANIELEEASSILNLTLKNSSTHSAWLSFMYPRLYIARQLLRDDGVIFISIDDNEQANLKLLCDEIFGEDNYIETFLWNKTQTPPSASNKTRKTHEFILCYQKNKDNKKMIARFSDGGDAPLWNETNSERILTFPANYVFSNLKNGIYEKGIRDKIELLDNVEVYNDKIINSFRLKGHFRWKQETLDEEITNNVFLVVKSDKFSIRYCREGERIVMPTNEISKKDNVGTNETASNELLKLFDNNKIFNFNKPVSLIKYLISICSNNANSNDIF